MGANRVLIILRMPGLGQQMAFEELTGAEATGIAREVLARVDQPDAVWRADDAFADPRLRKASATVRTFEIRSLCAVAIPHEQEAIGALYVDDVHRAGRFGDAEVATLQQLAASVGRLARRLPTPTRNRQDLQVRNVLGVYTQHARRAAAMQRSVERLSPRRPQNLLVSGPTGSGKTWFARRIATEVLGLQGLIEVVLFRMDIDKLVSMLAGTAKGEFTGAISRRGAIEQALTQKKALFLDEVQNLDEEGQRILLPLLELPDRRFGSLTGAATPIASPLHVILGTNADVEGDRWRGRFREDLWFRMSQLHVDLPPLAERGPDAIYRHLAELMEERDLPEPEATFDPELLELVVHAEWPGNLREMHTFVDEVAFAYPTVERRLTEADLPGWDLRARPREWRLVDPRGPLPVPTPMRREPAHASDAIAEQERHLVIKALEDHNYNQAAAARALDITRWKMLRLVKKHGLWDEVRKRR